MIRTVPIITFDTSAHNRLVDDGPLSDSLLAGIKSGLFFRFAGLSVEELISTPDPIRRAALFACCARLQDGPSDCLYPQNELLRLLIVAHFRNPAAFDWNTVDVRGKEFEDAISRRWFINDEELATVQCREFRERQKNYKLVFTRLRPRLQQILKNQGETPPPTLREAFDRLRDADRSLIWGIGKLLYDDVTETDVSEGTIQEFIESCPPFRSLIYAMVMSWYDLGVRDAAGEKFKAGGNDQFMSVYLPYCHKFVTAEKNGEQEKCLREIVTLAGLKTEVLSYDDFCDSFLVNG